MHFVRDLFVRLLGVQLVPLAIGWYVAASFFPTEAEHGILSFVVPSSAIAALLVVGALAVVLGRPLERALGHDASTGARRRAATAALWLPARAATVLLGVAALAAFASGIFGLWSGVPSDLVMAGTGAGTALAVMSAMLGYSVALGTGARALVLLGSVDVRPPGSVRWKVMAACGGLLGITTLLVIPVSYVRYRTDVERRLVTTTRLAQERAAPWVQRGRLAEAAELVHLASGAQTAILDGERRVVARAPDGGAMVPLVDRGLGAPTERVSGGWRLVHAVGPATIVSFLPDRSLQEQRRAYWSDATVLGVLLLLACAVVVWFAAKALAVPIGLLGNAANQISSGDLTASPPSVSRDELGRLAADFRAMARGLAGLVTDVQSATQGVQEGTREIGVIGARVQSGARDEHERVVAAQGAVEAMQESVGLVGRGVDSLSEYVHSTSTAVGEMASALEEIRRQASDLEAQMGGAELDVQRLSEAGRRAKTQLTALSSLAANAQVTLSSVSASLAGLETSAVSSQLAAAQAAEMADTAGVVVHDTVEGIESLRAAVGDAKRRVTALGRRSDDIDKILDFIGEVAGRTNLLSLNASIIATQAGEHGKAFAVVADQIRELAAQISSSTKSIAQIIRTVRDDVSGTARLIDRGDELAADGVARARKSLGALQEIRTATARGHETAAAIRDAVQTHAVSTREVSDLVASVAASSRALSEALDMVGTSVGAIGTVAQGIRALADGVSRALEEQTGLGRRQLESLELIDSMLSDITRAVESHDAATRRVREGLLQLSRTAEQHESAVVELSGVADRLGGRSRALADRVAKFKI